MNYGAISDQTLTFFWLETLKISIYNKIKRSDILQGELESDEKLSLKRLDTTATQLFFEKSNLKF